MASRIHPEPIVASMRAPHAQGAGRRALALALILSAALPAVARAQVRLAADAHTSKAAPASKFGGNASLVVSPDGNAFLAFDFSSLPAETTAADVTKAVLMVWISKITTKGAVMVTRLDGPWTEAGLTHNAAPPLGMVEVNGIGITKAKQFLEIDVTQLVRDTLALQHPNYGLAIVPQDTTVNVTFDSKESTTTSHEPRLTIYLRGADTTGGGAVVVGEGGNVGIGTSTPAHKLDVAGDIRFGEGGLGCIMDRSGNVVAGRCASVPEQFQAWLELGGPIPIPVRSFTVGFGPGAGASRHRITVERVPDASSPLLMSAALSGTPYSSARLVVATASDWKKHVIRYRFSFRAVVTRYTPAGTAPDASTELVELGPEHPGDPLLIETSTATLPADGRPLVGRVTLNATTALTFDILTYGWDATPASSGVGPKPFTMTKLLGPHSRALRDLAVQGSHSNSAVIEIFAPDGTIAARFTLTDAVILSLTVGGRTGDVNVPAEALSLDFAKLTFESRAADGTFVKRGWDYSKNVAF